MHRGKSNPPPPPPPQPEEWKIFRHLKALGKGQSLAGALPSIRVVILLSLVVSIVTAAVSVPLINSYFIISATIGSPPDINTAEKFIIAGANSSIQPNRNRVENFKNSPETAPPPAIIPFSCPATNQTNARICRAIPSTQSPEFSLLPPEASPNCPEYFRWIHEDLRPWRRTGITREMVERAGRTANFRLVLHGGRAFVQHIRPSFQTRDVFTLWGVVQLLRRYPGRLPDLELMFDTVDWPVVKAADYRGWNATAAPPPLFRYCGDDSTLDIVFPDWSFWGW